MGELVGGWVDNKWVVDWWVSKQRMREGSMNEGWLNQLDGQGQLYVIIISKVVFSNVLVFANITRGIAKQLGFTEKPKEEVCSGFTFDLLTGMVWIPCNTGVINHFINDYHKHIMRAMATA